MANRSILRFCFVILFTLLISIPKKEIAFAQPKGKDPALEANLESWTNIGFYQHHQVKLVGREQAIIDGIPLPMEDILFKKEILEFIFSAAPSQLNLGPCHAGSYKRTVRKNGVDFSEEGCLDTQRFSELLFAFTHLI